MLQLSPSLLLSSFSFCVPSLLLLLVRSYIVYFLLCETTGETTGETTDETAMREVPLAHRRATHSSYEALTSIHASQKILFLPFFAVFPLPPSALPPSVLLCPLRRANRGRQRRGNRGGRAEGGRGRTAKKGRKSRGRKRRGRKSRGRKREVLPLPSSPLPPPSLLPCLPLFARLRGGGRVPSSATRVCLSKLHRNCV